MWGVLLGYMLKKRLLELAEPFWAFPSSKTVSFSLGLIFKKLYFLLPAPSQPSHLAIFKSGFPHALKQGGFPPHICEDNEPPGHLQGLAIPKPGFPHALKHGGFPLRVCQGHEPHWEPSRVPLRMEPQALKVFTLGGWGGWTEQSERASSGGRASRIDSPPPTRDHFCTP